MYSPVSNERHERELPPLRVLAPDDEPRGDVEPALRVPRRVGVRQPGAGEGVGVRLLVGRGRLRRGGGGGGGEGKDLQDLVWWKE